MPLPVIIRVPNPNEAAQQNNGSTGKNPSTGETGHILVVTAVMLTAALSLAYVARKRVAHK